MVTEMDEMAEGGRPKRKGIYVHVELIHCIVWQKLVQHCKATTAQFEKKQGDLKLNTILRPCGE